MIDVEELICELHHIAGTESVDADIRRTACDAESALASLRAWVNELQMNTAEREAVERSAYLRGTDADWERQRGWSESRERVAREDAVTLRGLLDRHFATHNRERD